MISGQNNLDGIQGNPLSVNGVSFLSKVENTCKCFRLNCKIYILLFFRQRCVLDGIQFNPSSVNGGIFLSKVVSKLEQLEPFKS